MQTHVRICELQIWKEIDRMINSGFRDETSAFVDFESFNIKVTINTKIPILARSVNQVVKKTLLLYYYIGFIFL